MEEVLRGIDEAEVYIDNIGVFFNTWQSHIAKLDTILGKLEEKGSLLIPGSVNGQSRKLTGWATG